MFARSIIIGWSSFLAAIVVLSAANAKAQPPLEKLENSLDEELPPPTPGYLGFTVDDDPKSRPGAMVLLVNEDSPAKEAGLQQNDLITSIQGRPIQSVDDVEKALKRMSIGQRVEIGVDRAGRPIRLTAVVGKAPARRPVAKDDGASARPAEERRSRAERNAYLGVTVQTLTDDLRSLYGHRDRGGAVVTSVRVGGPAEQAGIPPGALIVAMDRTPINSQRDVINRVAAATPGQEVEVEYYHEGRLVRQTVRLGESSKISSEATRSARSRRGPLVFRSPFEFHREMMRRGPLEQLELFLEGRGPRPALRLGERVRETSDADSKVESLTREVERLRRRIIELEDELAAERAKK